MSWQLLLFPKVLARDDKWFITDLPGKWKVDYERRKEQYKTGYFSSINAPYKAFANYKNAEVSELLDDALSLNLTKQTLHFQVTNLSKNYNCSFYCIE